VVDFPAQETARKDKRTMQNIAAAGRTEARVFLTHPVHVLTMLTTARF